MLTDPPGCIRIQAKAVQVTDHALMGYEFYSCIRLMQLE